MRPDLPLGQRRKTARRFGIGGLSSSRAHQRLAVLHLALLRPLEAVPMAQAVRRSRFVARSARHWLGRVYQILFWAAMVALGVHWSQNHVGESPTAFPAMAAGSVHLSAR